VDSLQISQLSFNYSYGRQKAFNIDGASRGFFRLATEPEWGLASTSSSRARRAQNHGLQTNDYRLL